MLKEFKDFIMRGNVLDLAVGVIIGGAFTAIVTSLTTNLITPLIGLVISFIFPGSTDVDDVTKNLSFSLNGVVFNYGLVISAVITFLITAFVLFMIIKAVNNANRIVPKKGEEVEEEPVIELPETQEEILKDIRQLLVEQNKKPSDE
ncbi:MAG: large conductance mechanosensitive channel protein MscL [Vagococcus sp.]|uniref:large conductance mechanosensitive channel protein MscL n=1 Tax=Vagococcus TaxID=2737 RepID=UPI002FC59E5A